MFLSNDTKLLELLAARDGNLMQRLAALTEPVLQALHIVYEKVGRFEEIRPTIRDSQTLARSSRRPTAIVLNKQALR